MRISQSGAMMSQIRLIGNRIFERILDNSGVDAFTGPQGRILSVVWEDDGITVSGIAEKTGLARSTLTAMLDGMENADLIVRKRSDIDRRAVNVYLTEKAKELKSRYEQVSAKMTSVHFRGFTDEEIRIFEQSLYRILNNVKEEYENVQNINAQSDQ